MGALILLSLFLVIKDRAVGLWSKATPQTMKGVKYESSYFDGQADQGPGCALFAGLGRTDGSRKIYIGS